MSALHFDVVHDLLCSVGLHKSLNSAELVRPQRRIRFLIVREPAWGCDVWMLGLSKMMVVLDTLNLSGTVSSRFLLPSIVLLSLLALHLFVVNHMQMLDEVSATS